MIPNRLPQLARTTVRDAADKLILGIVSRAKKALKKYGNVQAGKVFDEYDILGGVEVEWLRIRVHVRKSDASGQYFPDSEVVKLYLDPSTKLAIWTKPGKWQDDLYSILAHEMTHHADPGVSKSAAHSDQTLSEYFSSTVERKAFLRQAAEEVADEIIEFSKKPLSAWKRRGKTPTEFLQHTLERKGVFLLGEKHWTQHQIERGYRDIIQFLEGEGLLAVIEEAYR